MKSLLSISYLILSYSAFAYAQNNSWANIYGKDLRGPNAPVAHISVNPLGLFIGGWISEVNGNTDKLMSVRNIAKWKDTVWEGVGGNGATNGVNGNIASMSSGPQGLYVCGGFDTAGSTSAKWLARWDGSNWQGVGLSSVKGFINTICAVDSILYAGGVFDSINGQHIVGITKYNGASWGALGTGLRKISTPQSLSSIGQVNAIACRDSIIYAGGIFDTAGTVAASNIAKWNGSVWQTMGAGINGDVKSIAIIPNGEVYVAGTFDTAGGVAAKNIAKWDGATWSAVGDLLNESEIVYALAVDSNRLYVGGEFRYAGSDTNRGLAMWDGTDWQSVGGGVSGIVYCLDFFDGSLYVGGHFFKVGNEQLETDNVAKWQVREPDTTGTMQGQSNAIVIRSYPNPNVGDNITIEFVLPESGMTTVQILSAQGQVLEEIGSRYYSLGLHSIAWKPTPQMSSQAYYCRIVQNGRVKANNIILQR